MGILLENIIGITAMIIMLTSIALQIKYIRFKKRSFPGTAEITSIQNKRFFYVINLSMKLSSGSFEFYAFKFKVDKSVGDKIEILYDPSQLNVEDNSIVISKILQRLNIYFNDRPTVYLKGQSPLKFYSGILLVGLLLTFL